MERASTNQSTTALWLCAWSGALGLLGLLGNLLGAEWLVVVIPGRPRMQLSTSLVIVVAACSIALRQRFPATRARRVGSQVSGAVIALFATWVAAEYAFGATVGVDWSVASGHWLGPHGGRPSPFTVASLAALGGALVLLDVDLPFAAVAREVLSLAAALIGFVTLVGHAFGVGALYQFGSSPVIGTALPTAFALSALGIAAWLARPQVGLLRIATAPGPGGILLRRLGVATLVGVPLFGGLFLLFLRAVDLHELSLIFALGIVLCVAFALGLLASTARALEHAAEVAEVSRTRAEQLFDHAPEGIFVADLTGRYLEVNTKGCRLLDFSREEILAKSIFDLIPTTDAERLWRDREHLLSGAEDTGEWRLRRKDGTYVSVEVTTNVLPDGRWQAFVRDITERKRLEHQTARALHEKEVLLREIHHRVKNNLQVISSLFSLQRERTESAELKSLLDEGRARVESIALVHEQLYCSANLAAIDFDAYLRRLAETIRSSYGAERVEVEVHAKGVLLDIEQAVPCALLLCELLSNSFKHAFGTGPGKVWVRAERDAQGFCVLDIGDNGRGMPADVDWTNSRSLGLRLVRGLARQLRATVELESPSSSGTRFKLRLTDYERVGDRGSGGFISLNAPPRPSAAH